MKNSFLNPSVGSASAQRLVKLTFRNRCCCWGVKHSDATTTDMFCVFCCRNGTRRSIRSWSTSQARTNHSRTLSVLWLASWQTSPPVWPLTTETRPWSGWSVNHRLTRLWLVSCQACRFLQWAWIKADGIPLWVGWLVDSPISPALTGWAAGRTFTRASWWVRWCRSARPRGLMASRRRAGWGRWLGSWMSLQVSTVEARVKELRYRKCAVKN